MYALRLWESQAGWGSHPPPPSLGHVEHADSPLLMQIRLFSFQQMERILKKASKTHKQRVEVSHVPGAGRMSRLGPGLAQRLREPSECWRERGVLNRNDAPAARSRRVQGLQGLQVGVSRGSLGRDRTWERWGWAVPHVPRALAVLMQDFSLTS